MLYESLRILKVKHRDIVKDLNANLDTNRSTQHITTCVSATELIISGRLQMHFDQFRKVQFRREVNFNTRVDAKLETAQQKTNQR